MTKAFTSVNIEFKGRSPATDILEKAGFEVVVEMPSEGWPDDETRQKLVDVEALLAGSENLNESTLDNARNLRVIARNGVGYDKIDLEYCTSRGIVVTNTPGAMADAVADQVFAFILALTRQIISGDRTVKEQGTYDVIIGEDLSAMTLGLVGCGSIGAEVVRRAMGFRMRTLVCDPWVDSARITGLGAEPVDRDQLLSESDVISLHIPLTTENSGIINRDFLFAMNEDSYLINTARGGLIDERALIDALRSGPLAGAGLDCQVTEPPTGVSLDLVKMENVIALPHSGSKTIAARERMSIWAAQSMADVHCGKVPKFVVNRKVLKNLALR